MIDLLLLLTVILAGLTVAGLAGLVWPRQIPRTLWAAGALAAAAAAICLVALALGGPPARLRLGIGLPGAGFRLVLGPASAFFASLMFASGAAIAGAGATRRDLHAAAAPVPLVLAAFGLAVLAADGATQASGLALAGAALWLLRPGRSRPGLLAVTLLAATCVAAAAHAPQPVRLSLAVLGPGALLRLAPLHRWLPPADAETEPLPALIAGAAAPVAIAAMLRLLFGVPGTVPPGWWSLPFLLLGAASVAVGTWDEARQQGIGAALAAAMMRQAGLIAIAIGLALRARAADLPGVAAMALQASLVLAAVQALGGTLLALASGAIGHGAGTHALDRLGGLVHRMPVTTACLLAGMFALTALPPSAGFAVLWLLFHVVLGLPHAAGLPFRLLLCAIVAVLGLAGAFNLASLLRLIGVACLGRPRTPRAAVAEEQPRPARRIAIGLAATVLAGGVFTGPLLRLLGDGPVRALTEAGTGPTATWLGLVTGPAAPGYAAIPLTMVLLLAAGGVALGRRRLAMRNGTAIGAAWNGGFAAPPNWLPFGDPSTQTTGDAFLPAPPAPPWRQRRPRRLRPREPRPHELPPSEPRPHELPPSELRPSEPWPSEPWPSEPWPSEPWPHELPPSEPWPHRRPAMPILPVPVLALILAAALLGLLAWLPPT